MVLAVAVLFLSSGMHDDGDDVLDKDDNCLNIVNHTQDDSDRDVISNECDPDNDNDVVD